jgi:sugar lactone lactonase YvrE
VSDIRRSLISVQHFRDIGCRELIFISFLAPTMTPIDASVWLTLQSELSESLLYDAENDKLYLQDALKHRLYTVDPITKHVTHLDLVDSFGFIGLIEGDDEHILAAAQKGVALIDKSTGALEYLVNYYPPELRDS